MSWKFFNFLLVFLISRSLFSMEQPPDPKTLNPKERCHWFWQSVKTNNLESAKRYAENNPRLAFEIQFGVFSGFDPQTIENDEASLLILKKLKAQSALPQMPLSVLQRYARGIVPRFNSEKTYEFWMAAMKGETDKLTKPLSDDETCLNLKQQYLDSYVQTALDWRILQKDTASVEDLCAAGACTFRYTNMDFNERYPDLRLHYDGRKSYHYAFAARNNKLSNMIEQHEAFGLLIDVNFISHGNTPLDSAFEHSNEPMIQHLLSQGALFFKYDQKALLKKFPRLRYFYLAQFRNFKNDFPNIFKITEIKENTDTLNSFIPPFGTLPKLFVPTNKSPAKEPQASKLWPQSPKASKLKPEAPKLWPQSPRVHALDFKVAPPFFSDIIARFSSADIKEWILFLTKNEELASIFEANEINGKAILLMDEKHIVTMLRHKNQALVDPAIKSLAYIQKCGTYVYASSKPANESDSREGPVLQISLSKKQDTKDLWPRSSSARPKRKQF